MSLDGQANVDGFGRVALRNHVDAGRLWEVVPLVPAAEALKAQSLDPDPVLFHDGRKITSVSIIKSLHQYSKP